MWRRSVLGVALAAGALLALVTPALAGGWAVTTLDGLPPGGFRAGETYRLSYTIRQHGDKPFGGANTEVRIRSSVTGEYHAFTGIPEGPVGHYVAEVRFPSAGTWTWEIDQYPFEAQPLGTIQVAAPAPAAPLTAAVAEPQPALSALRVLLPLGAVASTLLFGWLLVAFVRGGRTPATPATR